MIYIIGAGAIGKALAVSLQLDHKEVMILRGSVNDQPGHTETIQVVLENGQELSAEIRVSTLSNFPALNGIIALTNKSYGNPQLSRVLKDKVQNYPIVLLQNGLGVEQVFLDNHFPEIYRCVLFATSQPISTNRLKYKPVAVSPIGIIKGNASKVATVVEQLNSPGFLFTAESNIQPIIWKKAIINSVFNSICPLLEVDNGIFHRDPAVLGMAKRVIEECVVIARERDVLLTVPEVVESLLLISKFSDGQLISTFQDIRNKQPTEIDTLNFEIVRIAESVNKGSLVKETRLLGELTKLKSDLNR